MVLSEVQWNDIKRISWNSVETKKIRSQVHDDSLIVGWCPKVKRWMLARIIDATVEIQFGVKTIPTKERVPFIWKVWEDDDGSYLGIEDARLIPYIRRCDLWRMGSGKYLDQFASLEYIKEQRERSDGDELAYAAKQNFSRVQKAAEALCGTDVRPKAPDKFFFMN